MKLHFAPAETYDAFAPQTYTGMGALDPGSQQIASIAATGLTTTVGILAGLHTVIAGVAFAGPVGAAIAGIAAIGLAIANMFGGCGQTCVAATNIANQAESALQQNVQHYLSSPVHYYSLQLAALNNFDTVATAMHKACSDPALGPAGQRCISERLVLGGTAPWCPNPGNTGCDWITLYRNPIANDPHVVPDPTPVDTISSALSSVTGGTGISPLLLLAGAGLVAWAVMD